MALTFSIESTPPPLTSAAASGSAGVKPRRAESKTSRTGSPCTNRQTGTAERMLAVMASRTLTRKAARTRITAAGIRAVQCRRKLPENTARRSSPAPVPWTEIPSAP